MNKIKISEIFYAAQGEARYTGVPSIFIRTFGCNFRCLGFGMEKNKLTEEIKNIDEKLYEKYEDLPLSTTGCDSYPSSDPRFKRFSPWRDIDNIVSNIMELLPNKEWKEEHLILTGGEPLLGWQKAYPDLLNHKDMKNLKEITFETNGTQKLSAEFSSYLKDWVYSTPGINREITFSVSPKLSVSGEPREKAIKPEVVVEYQKYGYAYLKFVVATEEDAKEALEVTELYRQAGFNGPIYFMPVGGVEELYYLNNKEVYKLALKYGIRYSDRLHIALSGNSWGT